MMNLALDNRLFILQQNKNLSSLQCELLHKADVAYLQDRDSEAEKLVSIIENQLGV